MSKRILIIAYYFPPIGGGGAQRPTKFAKYLSQLGWEVTVLTTVQSKEKRRWEPEDQSLYTDVENSGEKVRVVRVGADIAKSGMFGIDGFENWSSAIGDAAVEILRADKYDAVLLTMSPFSLILAAEKIEQETTVPVVLDFRDPWVFDGCTFHRTYLHWKIQFIRMHKALENASGVIANTEEAGNIFLKNFSKLEKEKLTVIENGYDQEDFEQLNGARLPETDEEFFTLVFSGTLHAKPESNKSNIRQVLKYFLNYSPEKIDVSGRSLLHLLKAIEILREKEHPLGRLLRIECMGYATEKDLTAVSSSKAGDAIKFCGYLPHHESVARIKSANALFLPLHGIKNGGRSRIVPGKTYEYLATGRPILACVPEGDAKDFIEECDVGVVADPLDPEDIARGLIDVWDIFKNVSQDRKPQNWIQRYSRKALTQRLAEFVEARCE